MTFSEQEQETLLQRARQLLAAGYMRASIVDAARAEELVDLYKETGHDVAVLPGAVGAEAHGCDHCLEEPGLVTLFVRKC
jgi:hypothetical protein